MRCGGAPPHFTSCRDAVHSTRARTARHSSSLRITAPCLLCAPHARGPLAYGRAPSAHKSKSTVEPTAHHAVALSLSMPRRTERELHAAVAPRTRPNDCAQAGRACCASRAATRIPSIACDPPLGAVLAHWLQAVRPLQLRMARDTVMRMDFFLEILSVAHVYAAICANIHSTSNSMVHVMPPSVSQRARTGRADPRVPVTHAGYGPPHTYSHTRTVSEATL